MTKELKCQNVCINIMCIYDIVHVHCTLCNYMYMTYMYVINDIEMLFDGRLPAAKQAPLIPTQSTLLILTLWGRLRRKAKTRS